MHRTTIDLPDHLYQRLAELAQHTGQSTESVLVETLETALTASDEDDARLEAAIAAADRGETIDADVVHAEAAALLAARGVTPEQMDTIRSEVRAEAEAVYGVSLCD